MSLKRFEPVILEHNQIGDYVGAFTCMAEDEEGAWTHYDEAHALEVENAELKTRLSDAEAQRDAALAEAERLRARIVKLEGYFTASELARLNKECAK